MSQDDAKQRVSKLLAERGLASRRRCEVIIAQGRVRVNGVLIEGLGDVALSSDEITVDGRPAILPAKKIALRFHKPRGLVCTSSGHPSPVLERFREIPRRLFTVGRLDKETTGLLLVTDDGDFANRVMHPKFGVPREYLVKSSVEITSEHLRDLANGAMVDRAWICPLQVRRAGRTSVKIVVGEGRNREIRHLMRAHQLPVLELTRIRIGQLQLGDLPEGAWHELCDVEKEAALTPSQRLIARGPAHRTPT